MDAKEAGSEFLAKTCEYLISLPFDLKFLQEAASDPDLDRRAREIAASALIHILNRHEGTGPERYLEDVFILRLGLLGVRREGGDAAPAFTARFPEVYDTLDDELATFQTGLGEKVSAWLSARLESFSRLSLKGKKASQYVDDEEALSSLYEDGITFQTNYGVTETQVRNKLRRPEQVVDFLLRRCTDDMKRRPADSR
jgi:hypothetical protein